MTEIDKEFIKKKDKRKRLKDTRDSLTHKFVLEKFDQENEKIICYDGYLTVGFYEDGTVGEIFIKVAKIGDLIQSMLDALAISISMGLQQGIPLDSFVDKFVYVYFEPSGYVRMSNGRDVRVKSILDYIFKWLGDKFCDRDYLTMP